MESSRISGLRGASFSLIRVLGLGGPWGALGGLGLWLPLSVTGVESGGCFKEGS